MKTLRVLSLTLLVVTAGAAELPALRVRPQTIDAKISIGYGLAIADVDGDGKVDILLADQKQIVWYRNPTWEKFVMAENLTPKDHVCIAARDINGDGKCEVAVGAEWAPNDTENSGAVFFLEPPVDRTQLWKPIKLSHQPTTHRMHWIKNADHRYVLAELPLHGRGNKNNEGVGVRLMSHPWPLGEIELSSALLDSDRGLHATHNFDPQPDGSMLIAAKEGVHLLDPGKVFWKLNSFGAGEVRSGRLAGGSGFVTTIEPMHGTTLAVYREPKPTDGKTSWDASRVVVDETLNWGHGLATGDLLGTGSDQIVASSRGTRPGDKVGIKLYAATAPDGSAWKMHGVIDDNQMACEDLKLADLNGDGRLDVIAAGRATKNVIIYWNETGTAK